MHCLKAACATCAEVRILQWDLVCLCIHAACSSTDVVAEPCLTAYVLHAGAHMLLQAMQGGEGHTASSVWAAGRHRFHHHHGGGASLGRIGLPLSVPVSVSAPQPE